LQPLAAAEATLRPDERQMGVALVDIGGGTTDIAIFIEGSVWHSLVLGLGGNHLTNDIAILLRTPFTTAEELKVRYGHALPSTIDPQEHVNINAFGDNGHQTVSRQELAHIIAERSEEMLGLIHREIKRSGYDGLLAAGIVLTGGTAELDGLRDLATQYLGMPVRIGVPRGLGGMVARIASPAFSTATGLLLWGVRYGSQNSMRYDEGNSWIDMYHRFVEWLKGFLAR